MDGLKWNFDLSSASSHSGCAVGLWWSLLGLRRLEFSSCVNPTDVGGALSHIRLCLIVCMCEVRIQNASPRVRGSIILRSVPLSRDVFFIADLKSSKSFFSIVVKCLEGDVYA